MNVVGSITGGPVALAILMVFGEWLYVDTFADFSESFLGIATFVLIVAAGVFVGSRLAQRAKESRSRPSAS